MTSIVAGSKLHLALKEYFGFNGFKGNQEKIIQSILSGKDTLVIMPTGGGKSLCYQLPAILNEGTALIISPLIALMKNQVDLMRGYSNQDNIAHFMNSSLSRNQIKSVKQDLLDGHTKMLYVAPETLTKPETIEFFKQIKISFIAVDEAHCISEWGHDFRPEYRRIRKMVDAIDGSVPIIGLTATATPKVREDIIKSLQLKDTDIYISSFNRANLYYEIRQKGKKEETFTEIIKFVKRNPEKSGIVYCLNRKTTEEIAEALVANGIKAAAYHAGLDSTTRSDRQDQFLMEDTHVICATIAFGMGIDKPDVRFVIHYNMPKSLENYYQETGRAGRDGLEGNCIGFFNYADMSKLEKFMRDKPVAEREVGGQHISEVIAYSESASCRRQFLLHYFGEQYNDTNCNDNCDNCAHPKEKISINEEVKLVLKAIIALRENVDVKYLVKFLLGKSTRDITEFKHDQLKEFAKGSGKETSFWNAVVNKALLEQLLLKDIENYCLLKLTEKGYAYIDKPDALKVAVNHKFDDVITVIDNSKTSILDPVLYKMLKDLRKKVAKEKNVPTYIVFQERSLEEMCIYYPTNRQELCKITGVSEGKARKYGRPFHKLIAQYVSDNGIERAEDMTVKSVGNKSKDKIYIIQNIDKRITLDTIAKNLGLSMPDLITEIEKIIDSGTKLNIDFHINEYLDKEQQNEIFDYFMEAEDNSIAAAMKALNEYEDYSEEDIRIMRIKFLADVAH